MSNIRIDRSIAMMISIKKPSYVCVMRDACLKTELTFPTFAIP